MRQHALNTWQKFRKNKLALSGLVFIVVLVVVSLTGYLFLPDKTVASNNMQLSLALKKPGFNVKILKLSSDSSSEKEFWLFSGKSQINEEIPIDTFYQLFDTVY